MIRDDSDNVLLPIQDTDDSGNRLARFHLNPPLPPKGFSATRVGAGIAFTVTDRGNTEVTSGPVTAALRYDISWVADCDMSGDDTIAAAYARSVTVISIHSVGVEGEEIEVFFANPDKQSGFFFVVGAGLLGERSDYLAPIDLSSDNTLGATIPNDVEHLQMSESGIVHDGVVFSQLSVSCVTANTGGKLFGVQLFMRDYPTIGSTQEGFFAPYRGGPGGTLQFQAVYPVCRRAGTGTISATNGSTAITGAGTSFTQQAQTDDVIEILGVRVAVASVNSDTSITLAAPWDGQTVTNYEQWVVIGTATIYGVAISQSHTHRPDWDKSPSVPVLMDGTLSPPNAPVVDATPQGNDIRIDVTSVVGTGVDHYVIYRGTGTAQPFSACSAVATLPVAANTVPGSTVLQWVDTGFTISQRENSQIFSYYVTTVNTANQASVPSTEVEAMCRLDALGDNGPTNGGDTQGLNLMWNSMMWFSADATVDPTDANQDTKMGITPPPAGFYRWDHQETGTATPAGFQNSTEIILPGSDIYVCAALQRVDAWDNANGHIPKGAYVVLQFKARTSAGTANGSLSFDILQYDAALAYLGNAYVRQRLSNDALDETGEFITISASDLISNYQLYWGVFHLRTDIGCDHLMLRIYTQGNTSGVNINIAQAMLSIGTGLPTWTAQTCDPNVKYGPPGGGTPFAPIGFDPSDGSGRHRLPI